MRSPIKYLSLFSGIGGFELGIGDKGECIGYSETNKYAVQVYERHFRHKALGDVTEVIAQSLPDFDLLVGGFPCQSFSCSGKGKGFKDQRGALFFEIVRIVRQKRPCLLLLENVKGLLSNDKGRTFFRIISELDVLGYDLQWQVLNSKNFGVPQNRERVFIVGHLRGTRRPEVFPIGEDHAADPVVPTLTTRYQAAQATGAYLRQLTPKDQPQGSRIYDPKGIATTITSTDGGMGAGTGLYMIQTPRGKNNGGRKEIAPALSKSSYEHNNHVAIPALAPERVMKKQNGRRFKNNGEPSFTLTAQDRHGVYNGNKVRRLTPTECERLQGFPDGWTDDLSDSQRYKCLGNAVTVNVIRAIIKKLL